MMNESLDQYARIAGTIAEIINNAMKTRAEARKMALAGGATREQIDATDAKFDRTYFAPLNPTGTPPFPTVPPPPPQTETPAHAPTPADLLLIEQPDFSLVSPKDQVWFHSNPFGSGPRWFVAPIRDLSGIDHAAAGWRVIYP